MRISVIPIAINLVVNSAGLTLEWKVKGQESAGNLYSSAVDANDARESENLIGLRCKYVSLIRNDSIVVIDQNGATVDYELIANNGNSSSTYISMIKNLFSDNNKWSQVLFNYGSGTGYYSISIYENGVMMWVDNNITWPFLQKSGNKLILRYSKSGTDTTFAYKVRDISTALSNYENRRQDFLDADSKLSIIEEGDNIIIFPIDHASVEILGWNIYLINGLLADKGVVEFSKNGYGIINKSNLNGKMGVLKIGKYAKLISPNR